MTNQVPTPQNPQALETTVAIRHPLSRLSTTCAVLAACLATMATGLLELWVLDKLEQGKTAGNTFTFIRLLTSISILLDIASLTCAWIALKHIRQSPDRFAGKFFCKLAIVIATITLSFWIYRFGWAVAWTA